MSHRTCAEKARLRAIRQAHKAEAERMRQMYWAARALALVREFWWNGA